VQFTRLRLSGFKSFVDPTELKVEPGMTAIVGPNGCGKSNLVDAMRWVMGENSPKSIRGGGMDDVIFAGSATRPARNLAEVSLLIDNSERRAPAAFNDLTEIEVSRRIERDSGSAYRINGKEVRARDVQLLFADAATGAHSPALVGQGTITQLINDKPRDRRAILEEAAGISGLYSRRHEAELRLKAAENNLLRLQDVMAQLEGQLGNLKRQARQASRYRNISGHIRAAEAIHLHLLWTAAQDASTQADARLAQAQQNLTETTRLAAAASAAQSEASAALQPLRENEATSAAALHRLSVARESLDAEEARIRQATDQVKARLAQIADDIARESAIIAETEATSDKLEAEQRRLEEAKAGEANARDAAEAAVNKATGAAHDAESAFDALNSEAHALAARRQAVERQLAEAERRVARLQEEFDSTDDEIATLKGEDDEVDAARDLEATVTEASDAAAAAREAVEDTEAKRRAAAEAETETREELQDARTADSRLEAEASALAKLLASSNQTDYPPLIDSVKVSSGYEAAFGAALGEDANLPADKRAPIHWESLPPLEHAPSLPEGAEPLANYVSAPAELARRLSQIGLVKAEDAERLRDRLQASQTLVTREGAVWRWDGYTASRDAPSAAALRLSQRNRLSELESLRAEKSAELQRLKDAFEQKRTEAQAAVEAERNARRDWQAAEEALATARREQSEQARRSAERNSELAALTAAAERLETDVEEAKGAAEAARKDLEALTGEDQIKPRLDALRATVEEKRTALAEAKSALQSLTRESQIRTDRLAAIANERRAWAQRIANGHKQLNALDERAKRDQAELATLEERPKAIEEQRSGLLTQISAAEKERQTAADALAAAEEKLAECDKTARFAQEANSQAREERVRAEAAIEQAKERIAELNRRIEETVSATPDKLLEVAEVKSDQPLPPVDEIERRIERLKRERDTMGPVNLRAEAEAQELTEQIEGMGAERADLEAAIARLRQAIQGLNREGRERLLQAFEQVNTHFSELFVRLFGGGQAHLALTESDDPLDAGLEIMASPPGKKLQLMTLLSGGEQALTALSLIFAVFMTNPAPICVLDEVDAPLDEANVVRFCELMDEMTRRTETRFLVISHHPITMSRMNRLFGVTMAERGVSQLVSVDLEGVERLRAAE
jgi:chromosome segregation protein